MRLLMLACIFTWSVHAMDWFGWSGAFVSMAVLQPCSAARSDQSVTHEHLNTMLREIIDRGLANESEALHMDRHVYERKLRSINRGFLPIQKAVSSELARLLVSNLSRMSASDIACCANGLFMALRIYPLSVHRVGDLVQKYARETGVTRGVEWLVNQLYRCSTMLASQRR